MTDYRMYLLDPNGRIATRQDLDASSDAECITQAQMLLTTGETAEIWQRARCLGLVVSSPHTPLV
jgi:hypothetical protein